MNNLPPGYSDRDTDSHDSRPEPRTKKSSFVKIYESKWKKSRKAAGKARGEALKKKSSNTNEFSGKPRWDWSKPSK